MYSTDAIVIGAGVVGLAIARELALSGLEVIVLEKEKSFGTHTSSRNSEVIHAGIYYQPNTLKSRLCTQGKVMLYEYCKRNHIQYNQVGKYIVATNKNEQETLDAINTKAKANGVSDLEFINTQTLAKCYPQLKTTGALFSPSTGVIDSHDLMNSFVGEIEARGSNIVFNSHVTKIKSHSNGFDVSIADGTKIRASYLINAAGLWAGQVSRLLAQNDSYQQFYDIQFVRGRYLSYHGKHPFLHLIYPVPVKDGLGTHLTLDLGGQLKIGPDVEKIREISYHVCDIDDIKTEMYHSVKKYWPSCNFNNLSYSYCGIRPKATFKGELVNDFVIEDQSKHGIRKLVNLFGIESPGLTSCLGIAKEIKERLCI